MSVIIIPEFPSGEMAAVVILLGGTMVRRLAVLSPTGTGFALRLSTRELYCICDCNAGALKYYVTRFVRILLTF